MQPVCLFVHVRIYVCGNTVSNAQEAGTKMESDIFKIKRGGRFMCESSNIVFVVI